ncbi:restriction endonuclease subunit S [Streptomyces hygroscopicus subsp. sporocinereus]|uniref:Restriction endonuclease subunit S n=1 Tax=Streptomyces hygroscopicus TaxID=1912 RepID=A0ABQ3U870_STRHY|nr:hypothetical protein [Streptomyces hygroscopicus]GHJ31591.1 restriction endonuclease subunit S [Streptomyces hygroscopicus]
MRGKVPLGDLLQKVEVGVALAAQSQPPPEGEWGVLRLSALTTGKFASEQAKRVSAADASRRSGLEVRGNDVLVVRVNGSPSLVGSGRVVSEVPPRLLLSDLMFRLVPDPAKLDPKFLGLLLGSEGVRRQVKSVIRGTSGQFQLPQREVKALSVPDVPLAEQRQIVAAHAAFERRIAAVERVLQKLRVAEAALVARTTAGTQVRVKLGSWLRRIEAGKSPLAEDTPAGEGEWGVLKVSAVQRGWFDAVENKVVRDPALINPRFEVRPGDLIMTRANTEDLVGLACVAHKPPSRLMLSDKTLRLVVDHSIADPEFVELVLTEPGVRRQVKAAATGTSGSMKNIGQDSIQGLLVPDVSLDDQHRTVAVRAASKARMDSLRKQLVKLRAIQQGMVEDLLGPRPVS